MTFFKAKNACRDLFTCTLSSATPTDGETRGNTRRFHGNHGNGNGHGNNYRVSGIEDATWQPEESTPISTPYIDIEELKSSFHSMISAMQNGISMEISKMCTSVTELQAWMTIIESKLSSVSSLPSSFSTPSNSSSDEHVGSKRRRKVSVELHVSQWKI